MGCTFGMRFTELERETGIGRKTWWRLSKLGLVKTVLIGSARFVPHEELARLKAEGCPTPKRGGGARPKRHMKPRQQTQQAGLI